MAERLNPGPLLDPCGGDGAHVHDGGGDADGGALGVVADEYARRNAAHAYGEGADEELCGVCANGNEAVRCPGAELLFRDRDPFHVPFRVPSHDPDPFLCHSSPLPQAVSSPSHSSQAPRP